MIGIEERPSQEIIKHGGSFRKRHAVAGAIAGRLVGIPIELHSSSIPRTERLGASGAMGDAAIVGTATGHTTWQMHHGRWRKAQRWRSRDPNAVVGSEYDSASIAFGRGVLGYRPTVLPFSGRERTAMTVKKPRISCAKRSAATACWAATRAARTVLCDGLRVLRVMHGYPATEEVDEMQQSCIAWCKNVKERRLLVIRISITTIGQRITNTAKDWSRDG